MTESSSPAASPDASPVPGGKHRAYRWRDIQLGSKESWPLALGALPWGFVFGLLAQPVLDLAQTIAMSAYVSSGTAQFVALERWAPGMSLPSLLIAVFAVNARYLLMGATLAPAFRATGLLPRLGTLFFINDMSWALSMRRMGGDGIGLGYLLGASVTIYSAWVGASIIGYFIPVPIEATERWGLDFAVAAALIGLAGSNYAGRASWLPWLVSALVAAVVYLWVPGSLYIVAGGLAGALAGALTGQSARRGGPNGRANESASGRRA